MIEERGEVDPPGALDRAALLCAAAHVGVQIADEQVALLERHAEALVEWNRRLNLTRVTDQRGVAVRHFADSLVCLGAAPGHAQTETAPALGEPETAPAVGAPGTAPGHGAPETMAERGDGALRCIDIGSGAGLPGIPLAVLRPAWQVTLLEATGKKARFLEQVVTDLALSNVGVIARRAEELGRDDRHRESYDLTVARAVGDTAVLAEYCLPLLRVGGVMLALKGASAPEEAARARPAIELLGGRVDEVRPYQLPGVPGARHLVRISKVAPTPGKYPRRPGVPRRKPLA